MSNQNPVNYEAVLADLIARRDQLNAAIDVIQALTGSLSTAVPGGASATRAAEIRPDDFFGMTVIEASKKYLAMMKRPQSSQTITEALKSGGYLFNSGAPVQTVASILNRSDARAGDVVRVGKGMFGLAEWYPNRPRRKKANGDADGDVTEPEVEAESEQEVSEPAKGVNPDPFQ